MMRKTSQLSILRRSGAAANEGGGWALLSCSKSTGVRKWMLYSRKWKNDDSGSDVVCLLIPNISLATMSSRYSRKNNKQGKFNVVFLYILPPSSTQWFQLIRKSQGKIISEIFFKSYLCYAWLWDFCPESTWAHSAIQQAFQKDSIIAIARSSVWLSTWLLWKGSLPGYLNPARKPTKYHSASHINSSFLVVTLMVAALTTGGMVCIPLRH